jgi:hypothetical protein
VSEIPLGLCQCGCGQATKIAKRNQNWGLYIRKGEPYRFVRGHHAGVLPRKPRRLNPDADPVERGRYEARKLYALGGPCQRCSAAPAVDRHHKDGNTRNNSPDNIALLCRRCHMTEDGRLERFKRAKGGQGRGAGEVARDAWGRFAA